MKALHSEATMELRGIRKELVLLRRRWYIILGCLCLQYVHGIFTQLAYRMHTPAQQPLHDLGFATLPELPADWRWLSEALFTFLFISFVFWTFVPLLLQRSFSCVVVWTRLLTVLVVCQSLRILSFTSTQLPGPAPHCRLGTPTAHRAPASHWWQHVVVDVSRQLGHSCGDLIFSSHMTFILMGVLTYQHYGRNRIIKALAWSAAVVLALLIISARKHYTVDVVIAWYTAPLVYSCLNMHWSRQQQQQQQQLLQVNSTSCLGLYHSPCCSDDSCSHGLCRSCERCGCSCTCGLQYSYSCYSPTKKLQPLPIRGCSPRKGYTQVRTQVERAGVPNQDDSTAITIESATGSGLMSVQSEGSLGSPTVFDREGSWPRLAAVWGSLGHGRGGSGSSSSSGGSSSSWGPYSPGSSSPLSVEHRSTGAAAV